MGSRVARRKVWHGGMLLVMPPLLFGCTVAPPAAPAAPVPIALPSPQVLVVNLSSDPPQTLVTLTASEPEQVVTAAEPAPTAEPMREPVDWQATAQMVAAGLPTQLPRSTGRYWAEWPVVPPDVSPELVQLYFEGLALGNDSHAFSVVGDCQSFPPAFMGLYGRSEYLLDERYAYAEETIANFKDSFNREGAAVRDGQSVASALSPAWADPAICNPGEHPLACEVRLHRPSILFINLGTNWRGGDPITHREYLLKIVQFAFEHKIVPILSSKGDNLEGDHRLNAATATLAQEMNLPFWNFWRTLRKLPDKGIDHSRPGGYLTTRAWATRSESALLTLDAVWRALNGIPRPENP